jgi:hypothetical protein
MSDDAAADEATARIRGHRPVHGDAGVVDEDVEPSVLVDHLADDASAVGRIGDVALVNAPRRRRRSGRVAELLGARDPTSTQWRPPRRDAPLGARWRRRCRACRL